MHKDLNVITKFGVHVGDAMRLDVKQTPQLSSGEPLMQDRFSVKFFAPLMI